MSKEVISPEIEEMARWLHHKFSNNQTKDWELLSNRLKQGWFDLAANAPDGRKTMLSKYVVYLREDDIDHTDVEINDLAFRSIPGYFKHEWVDYATSREGADNAEEVRR